MGGIFPKALNAKTFWKNVLNRTDCITEVPKDRWDPSIFYDPDPTVPDKTYSKVGGFVSNFKFDPLQFRIPPNVSKSLEPVQQRILVATQEALEDAQYDKKHSDHSRTAVIFGVGGMGEKSHDANKRVWFHEQVNFLKYSPEFGALPTKTQQAILESFEREYKSRLAPITEDTMPGELGNIIAGRVANVFDFGGKNLTVDAACASSHAAFDVAIKGLTGHEFDTALTGGACVSMDPTWYVKFSKIGALSVSGKSRPLDDKADGFVMGEGVCVLVLKRLTDAIREHDRIYAVIRAVGSSSDGKGKGITAPNPSRQLLAIRRAMELAKLSPKHIQLIEAHATSTPVGDVAEMSAYAQAFADNGLPAKSIAVGSVKSQIGHLQSAAGTAGILKAALALYHKVLPPTINLETPNSQVPWEKTPFYVNTETEPWPDTPNGEPRRACVSAFGFGGINYHIILEEYVHHYHDRLLEEELKTEWSPEQAPSEQVMQPERTVIIPPAGESAQEEVVLVNDNSLSGLEVAAQSMLEKVPLGESFQSFAADSRRLSNRKTARVAVCASSFDDLRKKLAELSTLLKSSKTNLPPTKGIFIGEGLPLGKLGMIFPGQGSQYSNMLRDLANKYAIVRQTFDEADEVMEKIVGKSLSSKIFPDPGDQTAVAQSEEFLRKTENTQPAMLAADIALYRLLTSWGLRPDAVAGHSLGEYAALVTGGVLSFKDAVAVVSGRGSEMANIRLPDPGKMAAIATTQAQVEEILKDVKGYVIAANNNSPKQTVIAGESSAVLAACEKFNSQGIEAKLLNVSAAFHSAIVAHAQEPFYKVLKKAEFHLPEVKIYSNVTGEPYPANIDEIRNLLVKQIASPVQWQKTIENMYRDGVRVFLEVGPKSALTTLTSQILEAKGDAVYAFTNHPRTGQISSLNGAIARLLAIGFSMETDQAPDARIIRDKELGELPPHGEETKAQPLKVSLPATQKLQGEIKSRLMSIVAQKTGYPTEMLQTDLDMEADLGIDTVKQGEIIGDLREEYHLPREEGFKLKDYPTLNHVIDYLSRRLSEIPAPSIVELTREKSSRPLGPVQVSTPTPEPDNVLREIQSIFVAKTGYPAKVLDPTLDLEADLGIDTVKQAELFALVREKYGIPRIEKLKLKDFPNLNSIVVFVKEYGTEPRPTEAPAVTQTVTEIQPTLSTRRLTPRIVTWPILKKSDLAVLQGRSFLVTMDKGGAAQFVATTLRRYGARVLEVHPDEILKEVEKVAEEARKEGYLNGLLHLAPLDLVGGPYDFDESESERLSQFYGKSLFLLTRALVLDLKEGCVLAATAMGGQHGINVQKSKEPKWSPLSGAVTGLTKALAREFPALHVRAVDTSPSESADSRAAMIVEELVDLLSSTDNKPVEIGRFETQRVAVRTLPAQNLPEPGTVPISGDSIVISGGGRGITAEILKGLLISKPLLKIVSTLKTRLVILGRTSLPENVEELVSLTDEGLVALKQKITLELKQRGERATPVQVDRAFEPTLKAITIHRNIKALRSLGADVVYIPCDVSDERALKSTVDEIKQRYGPIGGVIHAAGTDESKRLTDKTPEVWDRVFHGKALGAIGLASITRDQPLRFFIMFGSIAGRFGNSGQADYCAASDVLAKLAHSLRGMGVPASTYDWSAWKTVGMATKGSVLKVLEDAGLEPLSIEDGVKLFLEEFSSGQEPEVVLTKTLGSIEEPTSISSTRHNVSTGFLAGATMEFFPGARVSAVRSLAMVKDSFLEDHSVETVPYLPGVLTLEMFIETSRPLIGYASLSEIHDISFKYPVKLLKSNPVDCRIRSEIVQAIPNGGVEVRSQLGTPRTLDGVERVNANAALCYSYVEPASISQEEAAAQPLTPVNVTHLYPPLFHGPTFQLLTRIEAIGPRGLKAHALVPKSSIISWFSGNRIPELEAAAHAAGVWVYMINNTATLYHAISRVRYARTDASPVDEFELVVKNAHFDGRILSCDVDVEEINGKLILQVTGLELISADTGQYTGFPNVIPFPHELTKINDHNVLRVPIQWVTEALAVPSIFDELLSSEERNAFSVLSLAPLKRRAEWMAGALAAKAALRMANGEPSLQRPWNKLEIRRDTKTGAPPTVDGMNTQVTITHAGKWAAAVAYDSTKEQVGVDVEVIEERSVGFLQEAFSDRERSSLRDPRDVTRAWCIKEAVLKCLRVGLREDLHQVTVNLSTTPAKVELTDRLRIRAASENITVHETRFDDQHLGAIAIVRK